MKATPDNGTLLGNLAALLMVTIAITAAADRLMSWWGRPMALLCTLLEPIIATAMLIAIVLVTVGTVVLAFSGFKRFELLLGGLVLGALPWLTAPLFGGAGCPV